jgi:predicted O-methyltransferase YrrM
MNKQICLNQSVLDFMADVLTPSSRVLEFGSGWSSAWFAARCGYLVTIETDPVWSRRIADDLTKRRIPHWDMVLASSTPDNFEDDVRRRVLGPGQADLVLVDCRESLRKVAAKLAWRYLRPGGWVVFDDAQRERHRDAVDWLQEKAGDPTRLEWAPGDIESAVERLALAWRKPAT